MTRSRDSGRAAQSSQSSTCTPLSRALAAAASSAAGSISQAVARAAPARAAATATTPEPEPKSSTVLPATSSGCCKIQLASTWPLAQQNDQYAGSATTAWASSWLRGPSSTEGSNRYSGNSGQPAGADAATRPRLRVLRRCWFRCSGVIAGSLNSQNRHCTLVSRLTNSLTYCLHLQSRRVRRAGENLVVPNRDSRTTLFGFSEASSRLRN